MLGGKHMPRGPRDQKRPADVISNAVHVMKIATGEIEEEHKDAAAISLGRKGGTARAKALTPARRKAIARKAAKTRWTR